MNISDPQFRDRYSPDFLALQRHLEGVIEADVQAFGFQDFNKATLRFLNIVGTGLNHESERRGDHGASKNDK